MRYLIYILIFGVLFSCSDDRLITLDSLVEKKTFLPKAEINIFKDLVAKTTIDTIKSDANIPLKKSNGVSISIFKHKIYNRLYEYDVNPYFVEYKFINTLKDYIIHNKSTINW